MPKHCYNTYNRCCLLFHRATIQHAFPSCYDTVCFSTKQTCAPALLLRHLAHANIGTDGGRICMLLYIGVHKICDQCWYYANLRLCKVGQAAGCIFSLNELKRVFLWNWTAEYLHEEWKYLEIILVTLGRSSHLGRDKARCGRENRLKVRSTGQQVKTLSCIVWYWGIYITLFLETFLLDALISFSRDKFLFTDSSA